MHRLLSSELFQKRLGPSPISLGLGFILCLMSERTEDFVKGIILDDFMFKGVRVTIQGNSDDEQEVAKI